MLSQTKENQITILEISKEVFEIEINNRNNDSLKVIEDILSRKASINNTFNENQLYSSIFYKANWSLNIPNLQLLNPFELTQQVIEHRTKTPITFKLSSCKDLLYSLKFLAELTDLNNDYNYPINIKVSIPDYLEKEYKGIITKSKKQFEINVNYNIKLNLDIGIFKIKQQTVLIDIIINQQRIIYSIAKYRGIENNNSICYAISVFQILFMIGYFKKAVFACGWSKSSVYLFQLQKLFYKLMTSSSLHVSITDFFNYFNWNTQKYKQHDAGEFFRFLFNAIDQEVSNDKTHKNSFKKLFEGKLVTEIDCIDIKFESTHEETFIDLCLPVKNCRSIYNSLDTFTMIEKLIGNNQYSTPNQGMQNAYKRVIISSFPKMLILQLNRFYYNSLKKENEKVNDYLEFYETLDLTKYKSTSQKTTNQPSLIEYQCFGVIVHSGSANKGHYYSFIRPDIEIDDWYEFNDTEVNLVEHYEVFHNNNGGDRTDYKFNKESKKIEKTTESHSQTAYMLFYIRKDCIKEIYCNVTVSSISTTLLNKIKSKNESDENQIIDLYLMTKESVESYDSPELIEDLDDIINDKQLLENRIMTVKVHINMFICNFINIISTQTNIPKEQIECFIYSIKIEKNNKSFVFKRYTNDVNTSKVTFNDLLTSKINTKSNFAFFLFTPLTKKIFQISNSITNEEAYFSYLRNNKKITKITPDCFSLSTSMNCFYFANNDTIIEDEQPSNQQILKPILLIVKYPLVKVNEICDMTIEYILYDIILVEDDKYINEVLCEDKIKEKIFNQLKSVLSLLLSPCYSTCKIEYLRKEALNDKYSTLTGNDKIKALIDNDAITLLINLVFNENMLFTPLIKCSSLKELLGFKYRINPIFQIPKFAVCYVMCFNDRARLCLQQNNQKSLINLNYTIYEIKSKISGEIDLPFLKKLFQVDYINTNSHDVNLFIEQPDSLLITPLLSAFLSGYSDIIQFINHSNQFSTFIANNEYNNKISLNDDFACGIDEILFRLNFNTLLISNNICNNQYRHLFLCDEYSNPTNMILFYSNLISNKSFKNFLLEIYSTSSSSSQSNNHLKFIIVCFNSKRLIPFDAYLFDETNANLFFNYYNQFDPIDYFIYPDNNNNYEKGKKCIAICVYSTNENPLTFPFVLFEELYHCSFGQLKEDIIDLLKNKKELSDYNQWECINYYSCNISTMTINARPSELYQINQSDDTKLIFIFSNLDQSANYIYVEINVKDDDYRPINNVI